MACWSTKAAISLKRVKIDEKLLRRAYRNSPMLFRTVPFPTPYGLPFPKIGGSQPQPKSATAVISGTGKDTDCKFGRYIQRVHPNTRTLSYRKDDCAVRPIYECPENFRESLTICPRLLFRKFLMGFSSDWCIFIAPIGRKAH